MPVNGLTCSAPAFSAMTAGMPRACGKQHAGEQYVTIGSRHERREAILAEYGLFHKHDGSHVGNEYDSCNFPRGYRF
jgi:hypothetical protein